MALGTPVQVARVAKDRGSAIIKTNARERMPLAIKRGPVTPGQRVYAIGSPIGKAFQGTVSSGVTAGDDYQIAFTADPPKEADILAAGTKACAIVTRVGTVAAGEGVVLTLGGKEIALPHSGYRHF